MIGIGEEPQTEHSGGVRTKTKLEGTKIDPPPPITLKVARTQDNYTGDELLSQSSLEPLCTKRGAVANLIGKKALIQCHLSGLAVTALLDTGAQVSMISRDWTVICQISPSDPFPRSLRRWKS